MGTVSLGPEGLLTQFTVTHLSEPALERGVSLQEFHVLEKRSKHEAQIPGWDFLAASD
jgi:hypothetical protein